MKLLIGNMNYSSWSLRPWLILRHAGIPFEEDLISFNADDFSARVRQWSPAGKVPVLVDGEVVVWDSLAIAEYLAEKFPEKALWPQTIAARARARSVCAEMHAGFPDMRSRMPMNCQIEFTTVLFDVKVRQDIGRVLEIWRDCRAQFGAEGPFLFGRFSVADAYFAPVTQRFAAYGVELPSVERRYVETIQALPAMQEWLTAARAENDFYLSDEPYRATP